MEREVIKMELIIYLAIIAVNICTTLLIVDYYETERNKKDQERKNFMQYLYNKIRRLP